MMLTRHITSGARHYLMTHNENNMTPDNLENLRRQLAEFAAARDWDQFHSPKNLAMALIAEAAELVEHFQWLTEDQSRSLPSRTHEEVRLELADILIYLIRVADKLDIDLIRAANDKISINNERYPADKVRGSPRRPLDPKEVVLQLLKGEV
uniref:NTP pyrophosphatase, house-cleaning of non-canonical NTPs n=1 Tax=Candidatus Kentrum sp. DK TaxID=2126562 RepID=A0A450RWA5_9GAMM|nr:MAG: NTP pyrophosphatase, house-cleaning of non-canonical NTPs [Candidatus Kentron sp. DK]